MMNRIRKKTLIILMTFLLSGCGSLLATADRTKDIKIKENHPVLEIWKEEDGSVPIRGTYLHFRLYENGQVEADYILRKKYNFRERERRNGPSLLYFLKRTPSIKLTAGELEKFRAFLEDVEKDKDIKKEYETSRLVFDVFITTKIIFKENGRTKKKIILDNHLTDEQDRLDKRVFPDSLIDLISEVGKIRRRAIERVIMDDADFESDATSECSNEIFQSCKYYY